MFCTNCLLFIHSEDGLEPPPYMKPVTVAVSVTMVIQGHLDSVLNLNMDSKFQIDYYANDVGIDSRPYLLSFKWKLFSSLCCILSFISFFLKTVTTGH